MGTTVREVVRDVIAVSAPQEIPLLDGLHTLDDEHVSRLLARRKGGRDPLGFGITEVAALVTPVVWLVVNEVVSQTTKSAVDGIIPRLRAALRRLLRRPVPPRTVPRLAPPQLEAVHQRVLEQATAVEIDRATATALADAVVARLARESGSKADERKPDPESSDD